MSALQSKEWILQAIDQLRQRKARPDLPRICHMAKRKHGLRFSETEEQLEKLVDAQIVIKVDYKGNISYRNAAKWRKSHLGGQVLNSRAAVEMLTDAVHALTEGRGDREERDGTRGVSVRDIERWLVSQKLGREEFKVPLHVMLQREVDAGRLEKLPSGNYVTSRLGAKGCNMKAMLKRCVSVNTKRGRPPKKKKLKRFYSYEPPVTWNAAPTVPAASLWCDYCKQTSRQNRLGQPEDLLVCKDCGARAHPTCMEYSEVLAQRASQYPWQCMDCKTCCLCLDSGDPDSMLFCDACDKGYHMNCHTPQLLDKPSGKWICSECTDQGVAMADIETPCVDTKPEVGHIEHPHNTPGCSTTSGLPTPCDSPVHDPETQDNRLPVFVKLARAAVSRPDASHYPDASRWTIEEVVIFFESIGFKEQADAFREQEIDGQSLLLMKRSDVLTGLSLRLGPALKIYQHVTKLQTAHQKHSIF
ncbi:histone acetyltransferase KAT6A-like [Pecten maximus]|uniref:histone acetyltransferase KAT6A-like n=1 Tax=Pecten maximus TaxID=6579 RepID=UPI001458813E|nr:histone acetyltransferase KAT6A-like [Pecten maximus]